MNYYLSSIYGLAKASIEKTTSGWCLFIQLQPKGSLKYSITLTQSGHKTKKAAFESWLTLQNYVEMQLEAEKVQS